MLTDTKAINLWPLGTASGIYESLNGHFMIAAELDKRTVAVKSPRGARGGSLGPPPALITEAALSGPLAPGRRPQSPLWSTAIMRSGPVEFLILLTNDVLN